MPRKDEFGFYNGSADQPPYPPEIKDQPCVICGKLTTGRYSDFGGGDVEFPVCKKHNPDFPYGVYGIWAMITILAIATTISLGWVLTTWLGG